jgi:hypothetical protein
MKLSNGSGEWELFNKLLLYKNDFGSGTGGKGNGGGRAFNSLLLRAAGCGKQGNTITTVDGRSNHSECMKRDSETGKEKWGMYRIGA